MRVAADVKTLVAAAESTPPALILVAADDPASGVFALKKLRAHPELREVPFVLVCDACSDALVAHALNSGMHDVWVGPLSPCVLKARVGALLRSQEEVLRLRAQVCVDELTGVFNRRGILGMLERETSRMSRLGTELGILLVDVDDFKQINDTYGHSTGDEVLRAIGGVLKQVIRRSDAAGRIGGDEFLVVLPDVDGLQAHQVAERIRLGISAIAIPDVQVCVGASIGVAVSQGHGVGTGRGLIDDADRSMYRRKRGSSGHIHAKA